MSEKKISIVLRARNAMARGLSRAEQSLRKFGESAKRIGAAFAKTFLAAGAAVAGFAAKAISAYAIQEKAENALTAAMNARGEQGNILIGVMKREAAAIQDATGAADEHTLASMAQLSTLGISADRLAEAAKATIALKSVGLEGAAAQKAVAMAMQGSYEALNRYIPALRTATSEEEKAAIVNDLFRRGYEQQAAQLDTVSGRWNHLKNRVGDVWEEIGRAINQNGALMDVLNRAGEAVKAFGERVTNWMGSGGVQKLVGTAQLFFEELRHRFMMISNVANISFASIGDSADTVFKWLSRTINNVVDGWIVQFTAAKDLSIAVFNAIRRPSREAFTEIGRVAKEGSEKIGQQLVKTLKETVQGNELVTKRTQAALDAREAMHREHATNVERISNKMQAALAENAAMPVGAAAGDEQAAMDAARAAEKAAKMAEEAEKKRVAAKEAAQKKIEALQREEVAAAKKAAQDKVDAAKKEADKLAAIAGKRVKDFIDEAKKKKDADKAAAREAKQMAELEASLARGATLSKRQQARLDAFRQIQAAKDQMEGPEGAAQKLADAQKAMEELQGKQLRELGDIKHEIEKQTAELAMLKGLGELKGIHKDIADHNAKLDGLLTLA